MGVASSNGLMVSGAYSPLAEPAQSFTQSDFISNRTMAICCCSIVTRPLTRPSLSDRSVINAATFARELRQCDYGGMLPSLSVFPRLRRRATLRRSWGLLRDVRVEQSDPDHFYSHLAQDTVGVLGDLWADSIPSSGRNPISSTGPNPVPNSGSATTSSALAGARVLDVGGGPGYFGRSFAAAGVTDYVTCEPDVGEMAAAGIQVASSVRGSGMDLPFADAVFDLSYSSNVAEHISDPWKMADEMLRVTRPGGLVVLSYTCWLGPFGGHETGLWQHYIGGEYSAQRYERTHGHPPKNRWGESLFNVSCADGLRYAAKVDGFSAEFLAAFPRYHPWWAWWLVKIPGLREFGVSNLVLVLRRT